MKKKFTSDITGKGWWKPFLGFLAAFIAALITFELSWMRFIAKTNVQGILANTAISFCAFFPVLIISGFFAFFIYLRLIERLTLGGKRFSFRGSLYAFSGPYVKGCILALLTLGLYLPELIRQTHAYLMHATEFEGHRISFKGKSSRLYRIFGQWLLIPVVAYIALLVLIATTLGTKPIQGFQSLAPLLYAAGSALFIASLGPFIFFFASWCCEIRFGRFCVSLQAEPKKASGFIFLQLALSSLTLGLYLPIAILRVWGYLVNKIALFEGDSQKGKLGFSGNALRSFALICGYSLLCVITFGIWSPWGIASIIKVLAKDTFLTIEK